MTSTANTEAKIATLKFVDLPAIGSDLEGGEFAGISTKKDGTHVAVIRLPGRGEDLDHSGAKAHAAERGGKLPSKAEAALLTSNLQIEVGWNWTDEEHDASYAWLFYSGGFTSLSHESAEGGALAVRRS